MRSADAFDHNQRRRTDDGRKYSDDAGDATSTTQYACRFQRAFCSASAYEERNKIDGELLFFFFFHKHRSFVFVRESECFFVSFQSRDTTVASRGTFLASRVARGGEFTRKLNFAYSVDRKFVKFIFLIRHSR